MKSLTEPLSSLTNFFDGMARIEKLEITIRQLSDGTWRSYTNGGDGLPNYAKEEIAIGVLNAIDKMNRIWRK